MFILLDLLQVLKEEDSILIPVLSSVENVPCDLGSSCDLVLVIAIEDHHTVVFQIDLIHDACFILFNFILIQEIRLALLSHQFLMALKLRHTVLHHIFVIRIEV